jgi:hypothetical protein
VSIIYSYVHVISCFGFGPVQAQQFSGHLYKEANSLGFRGVQNYSLQTIVLCFLGEASLRGRRCCLSNKVAAEVLVFIKDCRALV